MEVYSIKLKEVPWVFLIVVKGISNCRLTLYGYCLTSITISLKLNMLSVMRKYMAFYVHLLDSQSASFLNVEIYGKDSPVFIVTVVDMICLSHFPARLAASVHHAIRKGFWNSVCIFLNMSAFPFRIGSLYGRFRRECASFFVMTGVC